MDTITLKYKILFNLQMVLEGFEGDLNQYFTLQADEATGAMLSHYQTLSKRQKSAFTFLIKTKHEGTADGKPWVPLQGNEIFRFEVKLKDTGFIHNTHLDTYDFDNQVLFVTNATVNMTGNELLISAKPENYSTANTYQKGYLVKSGSNNYKALQPSSPGDVHGVTDTDYWRSIPHVGVSQGDLKDRTTLTEPVNLNTILLIEIDSSSSLNTNYRLLDTNSKVREVNYLLRFQKSN